MEYDHLPFRGIFGKCPWAFLVNALKKQKFPPSSLSMHCACMSVGNSVLFSQASSTSFSLSNNTNSSSVLSVAIEGSSGRILAILGLMAQKCPLFPLLFCPNYTVQLFFSAFLSHAAVWWMDQLSAWLIKGPIPLWKKNLKLMYSLLKVHDGWWN